MRKSARVRMCAAGEHDFTPTLGGVEQCFHCGQKRSRNTRPTAPTGAGHPETSRIAGQRAKLRSGTDKQRIFEWLNSRGSRGGTSDEAAQYLEDRWNRKISSNQAASRMGDLRRDGWVRDSGLTRDTRTGSPATIWEAIP